MSTTEGTTGGQGSGGSGSSSAPSKGRVPPAGISPTASKASGDTRPMKTVGQPGSGNAAGKTAERTTAPADKGGEQAAQKTAQAVPGKTAQAVPAQAAAGKQAVPAKKTAPAKKAAPPRTAGRRVRLTVSRVDPWSVMKMSFLLSVAIGIAMVVMVFVLWSVLAGMGIFERINEIAADVLGADGSDPFDLMDYIGLARVMSLSIVIAVIDVILITAIATLGAFLYNVSSALVGGLQLTLTDD